MRYLILSINIERGSYKVKNSPYYVTILHIIAHRRSYSLKYNLLFKINQ